MPCPDNQHAYETADLLFGRMGIACYRCGIAKKDATK